MFRKPPAGESCGWVWVWVWVLVGGPGRGRKRVGHRGRAAGRPPACPTSRSTRRRAAFRDHTARGGSRDVARARPLLAVSALALCPSSKTRADDPPVIAPWHGSQLMKRLAPPGGNSQPAFFIILIMNTTLGQCAKEYAFCFSQRAWASSSGVGIVNIMYCTLPPRLPLSPLDPPSR